MLSERTTSMRGQHRREAVGGLQDVVDDPRLATDLSRPPSGGDRRLADEHRQDQQPEHEAGVEETPLPQEHHPRQHSDPGQGGPHHDHVVIDLEHEVDRRGRGGGERVDALDRGMDVLVRQEAEKARDRDPARRLRGLVDPAHDEHPGTRFALVEALHRRELERLVVRHLDRLVGAEDDDVERSRTG